jgi:hypothetical protein
MWSGLTPAACNCGVSESSRNLYLGSQVTQIFDRLVANTETYKKERQWLLGVLFRQNCHPSHTECSIAL